MKNLYKALFHRDSDEEIVCYEMGELKINSENPRTYKTTNYKLWIKNTSIVGFIFLFLAVLWYFLLTA